MNIKILICMGLILMMAPACGQNNLIEKMKNEVPLYSGAEIFKTENPDEASSVIQYTVPASAASDEDKIIDFYRASMTAKGWVFQEKELKRWKKNGSVFAFTKPKMGKLFIQTITRRLDKKKKITVVLNWTRS